MPKTRNHCPNLGILLSLVCGLTLVGCSQKDPTTETADESATDDAVADDGADDAMEDDGADDAVSTSTGSTDDAPLDDSAGDDGSDDSAADDSSSDDSAGGAPGTDDSADDSSSDETTTDDSAADDSSSDDSAGGAPGTDDAVDDSVSDDSVSDDSVTDDSVPPDPEPGEIPESEIEDYFPLVNQATWTYRHTKTGESVWNEVVIMSTASGADAPGFKLSDQPNADGESTEQLWRWVDNAVMRVSRTELTEGNISAISTYDPGFTRFDKRWTKVGVKHTVTYTRVEQKAGEAASSETRNQEFEVLETDATVLIDDVSYEHCLLVSRFRPDTMELGHYWFARGIGKVKELDPDTMTTEELVDYSIP